MNEMTVLCKSTMYGPGCGHPTTDHDGSQQRDCCCCSRRHNDPAHVERCLDCAILHAKRRSRPGATYGEIEHLIPEQLRGPMWDRAIDRWAESEGLIRPGRSDTTGGGE
jgi:hypothetical protein